jgi:2-keto-4-pentenoate hydratase/2-oxohepta-3-ene-1,7-dioic acid hydratase in catechol pathway
MILLSFRKGKKIRVAVKTKKGILELKDKPEKVFARGLKALPKIQAFVEKALAANDTQYLSESDLELAPVVPNPGKILCVGLNYRRHAAESGMAEPKKPVLFSKFNNSLAAHGEEVSIHKLDQVDYEAELAVVIGRRAKKVSAKKALGYVLGYCNANDLSERALQFVSGQWLIGKTLDKFLPLGPYLVTADEIPDPQNLSIKGWLNGNLRQHSSTADMIFSVAEVISYASKYMTLEPGDVISTGTPEGVIFGMKEKVWMKPGDEYTVEISGLGKLSNRVVAR